MITIEKTKQHTLKKTNSDSVIILSRMYAGKYLDENIGHEIINLFKDDNGDNYIYINEDGKINPKYNDKVKAILLVRYVEKGVFEVIAKAEGLTQVLYKTGDNDEEGNAQISYIRDHNIRYANVPLDMIYPNTLAEKISISFKAEVVNLPAAPLYLIEDNSKTKAYSNYYVLPEKHFSMQSLKMYYPQADFPKDYKVMSEILANVELWDDRNHTKRLDLRDYTNSQHGISFLSIIRKDNDELVFSNLLAYYFEQNRELFTRFTKEVLGICGFSKNFKDIVRESKNNIDLWIEDDKNVIVIENKIKSKINGVSHDIYSDDNQNQLNKYYEYAVKNSMGRNVHCFIFSPDYNYINLSKYEAGKHYKIIHYSEIYKFYKDNAGEMLHTLYYRDFVESLYMHSRSIDNSNFETMRERFINKVVKIRSNLEME